MFERVVIVVSRGNVFIAKLSPSSEGVARVPDEWGSCNISIRVLIFLSLTGQEVVFFSPV